MMRFMSMYHMMQKMQQGENVGSGNDGLNLHIFGQPAKRKPKALMDKPVETQPNETATHGAAPREEPTQQGPEEKGPAQQTMPEEPAAPVLHIPDINSISVQEQANWLKSDGSNTSEKPKVKAKAKAKEKAKAKAKASCKAFAKSSPKAIAKGKAKAKAKQGPASTSSKAVIRRPAACRGWDIEDRFRASGQRDRYFVSPSGSAFRTMAEAESQGYVNMEG